MCAIAKLYRIKPDGAQHQSIRQVAPRARRRESSLCLLCGDQHKVLRVPSHSKSIFYGLSMSKPYPRDNLLAFCLEAEIRAEERHHVILETI